MQRWIRELDVTFLLYIYMHWAYKEDALPPLHAELRLLDRALTDAVAADVSRVQAVIMRDFKRIPFIYVCVSEINHFSSAAVSQRDSCYYRS